MITEDEKVRARSHMGYLNVQNASTFVFGIPAGVDTQFVIEGALNRILPAAEGEFRKVLAKLEETKQQIFDDQDVLLVEKVDEIAINPKAFQKQVERYHFWRGELGNLLGIAPNPYDQRFASWSGSGGLNIPINHG